MAFDTARGVAVLLGGQNSSSAHLWEWNGTQWAGIPIPAGLRRYGHAMAYDAARNQTVMYGGYSVTTNNRQTLTLLWNGVQWATGAVLSPPGARAGHAMVYDAARQVVVMFGGRVGSGQQFTGTLSNDTWEWNGTSWTNRMVAGPPAREGHAMAYDVARGVTVMFGGATSTSVLNDTWEWNGSFWTQRTIASPVARHGHVMVYDAARAAVVMYSGSTSLPNDIPGPLSDTWEYTFAGGWTSSASTLLPGRLWSAATYDPIRSQVLLVGGFQNGDLGNVSARSAFGIWSTLSQTPPQQSSAHAMDLVRNSLVYIPQDSLSVWERTGGSWTELQPFPSLPTRSQAAAAFHAARGKTVVFGGIGSSTFLDDTWEWDGSAWAQRSVVGPSARYGHAMCPGTTPGSILLYGGWSDPTRFTDTWVYTPAGAWNLIATSGPPSLKQMGMCLDTRRHVVVLYGGFDGGEGFGTETWEFNGILWSRRDAPINPGPRAACSLVFDPVRGVTILTGGETAPGISDTWEWDGCVWTQRPSAGPAPVQNAIAQYDPSAKSVVLFGGAGRSTTWTLSSPCTAPSIVTAPVAVQTCPGTTVEFTTQSAGTEPLLYEWMVVPAASPATTPVTVAAGALAQMGGIASGVFSPVLKVQGPSNSNWQVLCRVRSGNGECGTIDTTPVSLMVCRADFNCVNGLTVQDIFDFLAAWFAMNSSADFNGLNGLTVQDIFDFLAGWFAGC